MKASLKKKLEALRPQLAMASDLLADACTEHEAWIDAHGERWHESEAADNAREQLDSLEEAAGFMADLESAFDVILEP